MGNSFDFNKRFQKTEHLCSVFVFFKQRSYPVAQADSQADSLRWRETGQPVPFF
jgi:hypothetical protein